MIRPQIKPTRERDEQFLLFIKRRPCLVTGCKDSSDAHHVREAGKGGIGTKPSDRRTVPLCRKHHDEYHAKGRTQFSADHALILEYEIQRLNAAYQKLPQKRVVKRTEKPRIRRIEVTCICIRRVHRLAPSKVQGKRFQCPVTGEWVKAA